jgi:hypothetical protein
MGINEFKAKGMKGIPAFGLFIWELEELLAWYEGKALTGVSIKRKEDGWLLVITATENFKVWVTFIHAQERHTCYRLLWQQLRMGQMRWKESKYQ